MNKIIRKVVERSGYTLQKTKAESEYDKLFDKFRDFTMIPNNLYIENLKVAQIFAATIRGNIVECGVWRGGMSAGLAGIMGPQRKYYLFDSFEGLPEAKAIDGTSAMEWQKDTGGSTYYDNCKAEIGYAETAMRTAGADFELIKGWFSETLPHFKMDEEIALLRLDGDWYESTWDCLINLYPRVASGGGVIIDDYYTWDGCSKAVHDYLSSIKSASRIYTSPGGVCYIIKKD